MRQKKKRAKKNLKKKDIEDVVKKINHLEIINVDVVEVIIVIQHYTLT